MPLSPGCQPLSDLVNILAQLVPGAAVEAVLFTVPAKGKSRIQELIVCNRSATPATFRFSISQLGAPTATKDYIYFDLPIPGNDTFSNEMGLTLNATDTLRVFASTANLTFTLLGANT